MLNEPILISSGLRAEGVKVVCPPPPHPLFSTVFEINHLFCAPLGCTHFESVHQPICLCTPIVYRYGKWVEKLAHIGRKSP